MSSPAQRFYRDWYKDQERGMGADPASEPTFDRRVRAALAALGSSPKRILDFGCGTGAAAERFVRAGHTVHGLDISGSGIRVARSRVPGVRFDVVDSESTLPFPDGSFDACYSSEVIEHLMDVGAFLREAHRVLVPDGQLLLTAPYHQLVKNLIIVLTRFDRHFDPSGPHVRFFSARSLTALLSRHGFDVTVVRGIGRCWPVWKSMFVAARKRP